MSKYLKTAISHVKVLNLSTPLHAQFEIAGTCSDKCIMCYNVWHSGTRVKNVLSKEQHFEVLKILDPHIFSIIFSGGEPTDIKWLPELIQYCRKDNVDCSIITHGKNIDEDLAKQLALAGLQSAQVSLHHYVKDVSDWITGTEDSIEKTLRGIHNLLKYMSPEQIGICMVVNSRTASDVYEMGKFISKEGLINFAVSMCSYSGRAEKLNILPSLAQLHEAYHQLKALKEEFDLEVGFVGGMPYCVLPKDYKDSGVNFYNTCDAAISQIVIGPDGACRPCVEYPSSGGNILKDPLKKIWTSSVFLNIRMFRNVPNTCIRCKHVSQCHGGCRAAALNYTGSETGYDPLMCEVQK